MNSLPTLASTLALLIAQNGAHAGDLESSKHDAHRSVVAKLLDTGSVRCQPSLRYFCANIHVGCAGRTKKKTFAFRMRVTSRRGWIEPAGQLANDPHLSTATLVTNADSTHVILPLSDNGGYVKLGSGGRYSFRFYIRGAGVMSYGNCR